MNPELIVFDLAGTTVKDNHDVHRALQNALAKYGALISLEDANTVMGIPKPLAIRALLNICDTFPGPVTEDLVQEIHHTFVDEMIHFIKKILQPVKKKVSRILSKG